MDRPRVIRALLFADIKGFSKLSDEQLPGFAAALELAGSPFACDYVGHMPAAKDFGRLRMYRLRRAVPQ